MGYRLIRRIIRDDKCIGYYVENNGKVAPVSISIVDKYAKSNKLENVSLDSNGRIQGINGFDLGGLPVEQYNKVHEQDIKVIAINKKNGQIISYELESNGKIATVKPELFEKYTTESRISIDSIKTARINDMDILSVAELQKIYNGYNLSDEVNANIHILNEVGGSDEEKGRILNLVEGLESTIVTKPMTEAYLRERIGQLKKELSANIASHTAKFITDATNEIIANTEDLVNSILELNTRNTKLVAQDLMKIKKEIGNLGEVKEFESFRSEYISIKSDILMLVKKVKKLLEIQNKEQTELDKTFKAIGQEVEKIAQDDELREQKIKILHEPWCLNNKAFLSSNKYLENCYLTSKENGKQVSLSLARVNLSETFNSKGERTGFDVEYHGEKVHYNQILNNMNLLAAFIRLAEDEELLSYCNVNIVVKSKGESRTIQLGVGL